MTRLAFKVLTLLSQTIHHESLDADNMNKTGCYKKKRCFRRQRMTSYRSSADGGRSTAEVPMLFSCVCATRADSSRVGVSTVCMCVAEAVAVGAWWSRSFVPRTTPRAAAICALTVPDTPGRAAGDAAMICVAFAESTKQIDTRPAGSSPFSSVPRPLTGHQPRSGGGHLMTRADPTGGSLSPIGQYRLQWEHHGLGVEEARHPCTTSSL